MLLKDFINKHSTIRKGVFTKAKWQSITIVNGVECKKVSKGVIRFIDHRNAKGYKQPTTPRTNATHTRCLIPNALYYNDNTNNFLVYFGTTNVKSKSVYYINGIECDKATFETMAKPRKKSNSVMFRVVLENLLELGN